jgi:transcriptional regulator GlxA family with amidase domain
MHDSKEEDTMAHITMLAYPDCSVSSLICPIDSFGVANTWLQGRTGKKSPSEPLFTWDIVTPDGKPVEGFGRIPIHPHRAMEDIDRTDIVLIPGFIPPMKFIGKVPAPVADWLRRTHARNIMIGTICTGTFLLAETGLLDGREVTTNWAYAGLFQKLYPGVRLKPERLLTVDGNFICSGAATAYMELCLYLIEKFGSPELAVSCSKLLLIDGNRRSQAPYFIFEFQKNHSDNTVLKAQNHMERNLAEPISFTDLAASLGISPRHLKRRFKQATGDSPQTYLQRLRLETAKRRLESTQDSFEGITWQVGYENPNSFRRLFKETTGLTPREYRDRFSRSNKSVHP